METLPVNHEALFYYLSYKHVPTPLSIYPGKSRERPPVRVPDFQSVYTGNFGQAMAIMDNLLLSQMYRLTRDLRETSILLSGGVDSGIVTAIASEVSPRPVETYCLVYPDESGGQAEDRQFAREIADMYNTRHYEVPVDYDDIARALSPSLAILGEPFSGYVSPYLIGKALATQWQGMRPYRRQVITGDWGDELFGSYRAHRLAVENPHVPPAELRYLTSVFTDPEKKDLLMAPTGNFSTLEHLETYEHSLEDVTHDSLAAMLRAEFASFYPDHTYLAFHELTKHWGVECYSPFSSPVFADFAASLPMAKKYCDGEAKYIERRMAEAYLPNHIAHRSKQGFTTTTINLCLALESWIRDLLSPRHLGTHGLFNIGYVQDLVQQFYTASTEPLAYKVWNLVCFQVWYDEVRIA